MRKKKKRRRREPRNVAQLQGAERRMHMHDRTHSRALVIAIRPLLSPLSHPNNVLRIGINFVQGFECISGRCFLFFYFFWFLARSSVDCYVNLCFFACLLRHKNVRFNANLIVTRESRTMSLFSIYL